MGFDIISGVGCLDLNLVFFIGCCARWEYVCWDLRRYLTVLARFDGT